MSFEIHDQKLYHYVPEPEETEIIIPDSVISIEEEAFASAGNLTGVPFLDSLVCIRMSTVKV